MLFQNTLKEFSDIHASWNVLGKYVIDCCLQAQLSMQVVGYRDVKKK